jgi:hypothetical protein
MFNLENAVDNWCKSVGVSQNSNAELFEELKDHLYCEIETLEHEGLSSEQAFNLASKKMGEPRKLIEEYNQNRSLFTVLCRSNEPNLNEYTQQRNRVMNYRKSVKRILSQSILWAATILVSALLLGDSEQYSTYMLLLLVIAMTSIFLDPDYKDAARVECEFIRKKLAKLKSN